MVNFTAYKANVWYDVIVIDVGYILVGRPWLIDNNVLYAD